MIWEVKKMKLKRVVLITGTLFLTACGYLGINGNTASAHSWSWWAKPRTVVLTKPRYIYEIQGTTPRYKSYEVRKKLLKAGTTLKIQHVASYDWLVTKRGYANGYFKNNQKFWVMNDSKGNWKKLYKRSKQTRKAKKQRKTTITANKTTDNLKEVAKMTAKPYLGGDLIRGYFANIPKRGTMNFAFYHDAPNFEIKGDFINITGQPVKLEDYLNNYFTYQLPTSDLGDGNHYVTFHTTQIVAPYSHANFKAISNGPKNANDIDKLLMETRTDNTDVKLPFMGVRVPVF